MSASPCPSAHIADDVLYGDENGKFVQPVVNSTSQYLNNLTSTDTKVSQIVSSTHQSQTYKHFLAQKYAAESTSDVDSELHSNSVNQLSHANQAFQHQISNFYPFSPLVSSSSHFDTRNILGDGVLESSVDSLQVESSTNEQNSGHASQALFTENISALDGFIKHEESPNLAIASNPSVTSSSNRSNESNLCQVELVPSSLFDAVNNDGTVDSTTTASISTSTNLNSALSSYSFNNFPSTSQASLSGVLTYGISPNFSSTLLQIENSQHLLPSLPSPSIQIDQYFNHPNSLEKREDNVILDQHQILPNSIQPFSNENHCLLSDSFLHDIPNESYNDNEILNSHENVISDLPVLTRARASLPIEYLYLNETETGSLGIFARKTIPARTQFGPIEGVIASFSDSQFSPSNIAFSSKSSLIIFISDSVLLSQVDENNSNWTRFVRPADNAVEQNLELITKEFTSVNELKFFFYTTRNIMPNEELKVWYSKEYSERFNIRLLQTSEHLGILTESELEVNQNHSSTELPNGLPVTSGGHKLRTKIAKSQLSQIQQNQECNKNSDQLSPHDSISQVLDGSDLFDSTGISIDNEQMICVDLNKNIDSLLINNNTPDKVLSNEIASKSKEAKANQFECTICHRVFPRHYSLRRHLVMHSGEKKYKCPVCNMAFNHVYNRNRHLKKHKPVNDCAIEHSKPNIEKNEENAQITSPVHNAPMEVICTGIPKPNSPIETESIILPNTSTIESLIESSFCKNDDNNNFIVSPDKENNFDTMLDSNKNSPETTSSESSSNCDNVTSSMTAGGSLDENKSQLLNSINKNCADKLFRCHLCYKRFSTEERLDKHSRVHDESAKHLSCTVCKRKFLTNSALACHIKSHSFPSNEPRKYDCTLCGEVFDTIQMRREHVVVHINPETALYHCSKCSKTFEDFSPIRKHIKSFHSEEIFPCRECDKVFPRQDKLRLHMLCHSDRWEFKCNFCDKQFKRKDKLKEHAQRMHAPDRDVRIAAKLAARMQRLKAQRTKKIATKPSQPNYHEFVYKCHQCLLGFKRRGMLVNHLAKRHPDVPYNTVPELNMPIVKTSKDYFCQYCEKIYKSSSKRKAHIIKNHPGKSLPPSNRNKGIPAGIPTNTFSTTVGSITINPHFCSWCHKQYASKAKLMQHQRKKHPEEINIYMSSKHKSDVSFTCTSNSESSVGSLKLDSIASSEKSSLDIISQSDSLSVPLIKSEGHQMDSIALVDSYKDHKLNTFLSNASSNNSFIDAFGLTGQYTKNGLFLNGNNLPQEAQYTIDSNDQCLDDLLNITTCIVSEEPNHNLLINNSGSHSSISNNIITILSLPSAGTAFSNDLGEFPAGITDIITQMTSDFSNNKLLSSHSNSLNSEAGNSSNNNLIIHDPIEENNWNQVCEEMAI